MPRAILEFELPGDERAFRVASEAQEIIYGINQALSEIRGILKYKPDELSDGEKKGLERARDIVIGRLEDRDVSWVLD